MLHEMSPFSSLSPFFPTVAEDGIGHDEEKQYVRTVLIM